MQIYNKLVRDRIPEIIEKSGKKAEVTTLEYKDYYQCLVKKLSEEVQEFIESDNKEEIADILEVLDCILKVRGSDWDSIRKVQDEKRTKNGGFDGKYFLVSVEG